MTKQTKTNNLDYLIDPTFNKVNRLFVLSFKNEDDKTSSSSVLTSVEIKDFNVLIDGKRFFNPPIKIKKRHMKQMLKWEKIMITKQVIYWIGYFSNHYKLIAIDSSKQIELENPDLK